MPQVFKIGVYSVYFWSNENRPLEPIHVHVSVGRPSENGTKIWLTRAGHCIVAHNRSKIPERILSRIKMVLESRNKDIVSKWLETFGEITYFC